MSETDHSETSDATIEPFLFDRVLELLESGAVEALESHDYLSYSTLLDIYLSDPSKYTNAERELLLQLLLDVLKEHPDLTYEIGWDLPALLVLYVESDYDFQSGLRYAPCIYKILKIFECLALTGNPKELLLKSCELLTLIRLDKPTIQEYEKDPDAHFGVFSFFDLKLYCIFELIVSCLKRIKTYYPSRFLAMTVAAFVNTARTNVFSSSSLVHFVLRRAYSFARNYDSLPLPDEITLSKLELEEVTASEKLLERKLLTAFITQIVHVEGSVQAYGFVSDHYNFLQGRTDVDGDTYTTEAPVMDRLYELALSCDINPNKVLKQYVADAHKLFDTFDYTRTDHDELSGEIFEKIIVDYQQNVASALINSSQTSIKDSVLGTMLLGTYDIAKLRQFDLPFSIKDAIVMGLRLLIPGMVNPAFSTSGTNDLAVFWMWYSLYKLNLEGKNIEVEFAGVPTLVLQLYFQVLLWVGTLPLTLPRKVFNYISLTLLTKILAQSPESVSYEFIRDALHSCPYPNTRAILVGVLKELLTKNKESVSKQLEATSLTPAEAPPLPSRDQAVVPVKYFSLDEKKFADIIELIDTAIADAFVETEKLAEKLAKKVTAIDPSELGTVSAYLNLLVVLKRDKVVIANKALFDAVVAKAKAKISKIQQKYTNGAQLFELNAADMLALTIDRIET